MEVDDSQFYKIAIYALKAAAEHSVQFNGQDRENLVKITSSLAGTHKYRYSESPSREQLKMALAEILRRMAALGANCNLDVEILRQLHERSVPYDYLDSRDKLEWCALSIAPEKHPREMEFYLKGQELGYMLRAVDDCLQFRS